MDFLQPTSWAEALEAKAAHPDAVPVAGGTDVMVGINFGRLRPAALLDLTRVAELQEWSTEDGAVRLGAGVSYARVITELGAPAARPGDGLPHHRLPADPQPRHASAATWPPPRPAGDAHPALLAADAVVEVASVRGSRRIPITDFYTGRQAQRAGRRRADRAPSTSIPPSGPQQYSKIGTRNAMVIAVARLRPGAAPRPAAPSAPASARPRRPRAGRPTAEEFLAGELDERRAVGVPRRACPPRRPRRFGELVAGAGRPDRRRPRHRRATAVHALVGDGPPHADLGLDRLPRHDARRGSLTCA